MLTVQTFFTVSDSFNICAELSMKCLVIMSFVIYAEILLRTNFIAQSTQDKLVKYIVVISGELLLQIFITDYHLYMSSRSFGKSRGNRYTIDLNMVLKNIYLFREFEDQLKREFHVENLNFLVSCIHYRRTVTRQGHFGIGTSISECENETFEMLNWRETMPDEDRDPNKIARFIYSEFCVQGAPQQISLDNDTFKRLSARMRSLSNIYNYSEQDLFSEAFDLIYNQLDNDPLIRLKRKLKFPRDIPAQRDRLDSQGYGITLLTSKLEH